jgi:hypothetical protein
MRIIGSSSNPRHKADYTGWFRRGRAISVAVVNGWGHHVANSGQLGDGAAGARA